jgi:hypothetical protein
VPSIEQEELESRFLNEKDRGQTGRWRLDAGKAVTCDHRRWGICDCRKGRHCRRQCVLHVGSGRTIPVIKDARVGSGRTIPVVREALGGLTLGQRERGAERADSETARSEYLGVRRRCKGRVHPGAGYPEGLPCDSGRGMPWDTTGQDEVSVREERTASVLTRSRPAESRRNRRQLCWQCGGTCHLRRESLGGRNQGAENTNSVTRGCTGTKGGRPEACDLPESASCRRRPSRTSRTCRPNKGAAGQLPNESSPEASDHPYRVQRHLRVKMMAVRVGRRAPYLGGCSGRAALRRGQCHILGFPGNATMKTKLLRNYETRFRTTI